MLDKITRQVVTRVIMDGGVVAAIDDANVYLGGRFPTVGPNPDGDRTFIGMWPKRTIMRGDPPGAYQLEGRQIVGDPYLTEIITQGCSLIVRTRTDVRLIPKNFSTQGILLPVPNVPALKKADDHLFWDDDDPGFKSLGL
jgi:hypothetical protein